MGFLSLFPFLCLIAISTQGILRNSTLTVTGHYSKCFPNFHSQSRAPVHVQDFQKKEHHHFLNSQQWLKFVRQPIPTLKEISRLPTPAAQEFTFRGKKFSWTKKDAYFSIWKKKLKLLWGWIKWSNGSAEAVPRKHLLQLIPLCDRSHPNTPTVSFLAAHTLEITVRSPDSLLPGFFSLQSHEWRITRIYVAI